MLDRAKAIFYRGLTAVVLAAGLGVLSCNPFAPGLDDAPIDPNELLGDRRTLDGFFEWFRNAYELRDSVLYGQLIDPAFRFSYFDFQNNVYVSWDRDTEMLSTYNLFRGVQSTSLRWNNYVFVDTTGSDTVATVERAFNLSIVQDEQNIFMGTGSAQIQLVRNAPDTPWRMRY
ncbi:MAG: hypothetical protein WBA12_14855, partial [Catalinimonas sp.]